MQVKRHEGNTNPAPTRATRHSAGFDLTYFGPTHYIGVGERFLAPTGFDIELDEETLGFVVPRSGMAAKHGVTVLNSPGTCDADFRGEIKVILINHGDIAYQVRNGDRIAQLIIMRYEYPWLTTFDEVSDLSDTDRGSGGFGSTGK